MNTTEIRAPTGPDPATGMAGTASAAAACLPEPSGLTPEEICRIVLDLIG